MKLEVGMYYRYDGKISVIKEMIYQDYTYIQIQLGGDLLYKNKIKASYNIIDILEVGDYVNGLPVTKISEYISTHEKYIELYGTFSDWENEDIKSIVTHEQMEQMKYEVGK